MELKKTEPKYKVTVQMKKPWTDRYWKKPTKGMVLEALADEILEGSLDDIFEITIEEVPATGSNVSH